MDLSNMYASIYSYSTELKRIASVAFFVDAYDVDIVLQTRWFTHSNPRTYCPQTAKESQKPQF
jgi:hypothetical protein